MENTSRRRILVIDDSADMCALLKMLLEADGYRVDCTPNGQEALSLLRQLLQVSGQDSGDLPELILLDDQMPVMNGREFRTHQMNDPRLKEIPVIVMSGNNTAEMAAEMRHPMMILGKPTPIQLILDAVAYCLEPAAA